MMEKGTKEKYCIIKYSEEIIKLDLSGVQILYASRLWKNPHFNKEGKLDADIEDGIPGISFNRTSIERLIKDHNLFLAVPEWVVELFDLKKHVVYYLCVIH